MASPTPQPSKLKILKGNPGRRPIPDEIEITKNEIECPSTLKGAQKKKFKEMVELYRKSQLLELIDTDLLAEYCILWCEWWDVQEAINKHGLILTDEIGIPYTTPLLDKSLKLIDSMRRYKEVLGMGPGYRAKLSRDMNYKKPEEKAEHPLKRCSTQL